MCELLAQLGVAVNGSELGELTSRRLLFLYVLSGEKGKKK